MRFLVLATGSKGNCAYIATPHAQVLVDCGIPLRDVANGLKAHGIVTYRLESQIERQRFLFRCEYPTPDDSHVTELFEAIAETPLDAVLETLKQIDEWLDQCDRVDREGGP